MGLDINKIINEAIEETLEEDNDESMYEVSDDTKKKLKIGAGAAGAAGGVGALASTDRGQAAISKAGEAVSAGASAAKAGAGKAYDATKAAVGRAAENLAGGSDKAVEGSIASQAKEDLIKLGQKGMAAAKGEYKNSKAASHLDDDLNVLGRTGLSVKKMFNDTAIASALSAGMGAKAIVEQIRKIS